MAAQAVMVVAHRAALVARAGQAGAQVVRMEVLEAVAVEVEAVPVDRVSAAEAKGLVL